MESISDVWIAVILYVAVVAAAMCWFLLPRWVSGSPASSIRRARRMQRQRLARDDELRRQGTGHWRQAPLFPDSSLH